MESIIVEKEYGHNFFTSYFIIIELVDCAWWTTDTHRLITLFSPLMTDQLSNMKFNVKKVVLVALGHFSFFLWQSIFGSSVKTYIYRIWAS